MTDFTQCWNASVFEVSLQLHCAPVWRYGEHFLTWVALSSNEAQNLGSVGATLCPLSNAHYVFFPSESFYVYFMIYCLHLFWAAMKNTPSG